MKLTADCALRKTPPNRPKTTFGLPAKSGIIYRRVNGGLSAEIKNSVSIQIPSDQHNGPPPGQMEAAHVIGKCEVINYGNCLNHIHRSAISSEWIH